MISQKNITFFVTLGGSCFEKIAKELHVSALNAAIKEGKLLNTDTSRKFLN